MNPVSEHMEQVPYFQYLLSKLENSPESQDFFSDSILLYFFVYFSNS